MVNIVWEYIYIHVLALVLVAYLIFTDLWCSLFENISTHGQDLVIVVILKSLLLRCNVLENIYTHGLVQVLALVTYLTALPVYCTHSLRIYCQDLVSVANLNTFTELWSSLRIYIPNGQDLAYLHTLKILLIFFCSLAENMYHQAGSGLTCTP